VGDFGERFADMSAPYDASLSKIIKEIAKEENIALQEGVYAAVVGPQLETRAEYRMLKNFRGRRCGHVYRARSDCCQSFKTSCSSYFSTHG